MIIDLDKPVKIIIRPAFAEVSKLEHTVEVVKYANDIANKRLVFHLKNVVKSITIDYTEDEINDALLIKKIRERLEDGVI